MPPALLSTGRVGVATGPDSTRQGAPCTSGHCLLLPVPLSAVVLLALVLLTLIGCSGSSPDAGAADTPAAVPTATRTESQRATVAAEAARFNEQLKKRNAFWDAFREADTGEWELEVTGPSYDDSPTASVRATKFWGPSGIVGVGKPATMMVSCVPAEKVQVSFIRDAYMTRTRIRLYFYDDSGTHITSLPSWDDEPARGQFRPHGTL